MTHRQRSPEILLERDAQPPFARAVVEQLRRTHGLEDLRYQRRVLHGGDAVVGVLMQLLLHFPVFFADQCFAHARLTCDRDVSPFWTKRPCPQENILTCVAGATDKPLIINKWLLT